MHLKLIATVGVLGFLTLFPATPSNANTSAPAAPAAQDIRLPDLSRTIPLRSMRGYRIELTVTDADAVNTAFNRALDIKTSRRGATSDLPITPNTKWFNRWGLIELKEIQEPRHTGNGFCGLFVSDEYLQDKRNKKRALVVADGETLIFEPDTTPALAERNVVGAPSAEMTHISGAELLLFSTEHPIALCCVKLSDAPFTTAWLERTLRRAFRVSISEINK